nr:hypothetical protein [Lysobacter sp.]
MPAMILRPTLKPALAACLATLLAACTSMPAPTVRRDGAIPRIQRPATAAAQGVPGAVVVAEPLDGDAEDGPQA